MFFVRFLWGWGGMRGKPEGRGLGLRNAGLFLLWTGISLDCKREMMKKKKNSHVVEFLLNCVSYSMPSIVLDECQMYMCKVWV